MEASSCGSFCRWKEQNGHDMQDDFFEVPKILPIYFDLGALFGAMLEDTGDRWC